MTVARFEKGELEEMFDRVDANGDRRIGFEEFTRLMREVDPARSEASVRAGFAAIDRNRNGEISFVEFREWIMR